jgi:hypothetical protein
MICPTCKSAGFTSVIRVASQSTTCMYFTPHYDEDGNYHNHDANRFRSDAYCSRGHNLEITSFGTCQCGWTGGTATIKDVGDSD